MRQCPTTAQRGPISFLRTGHQHIGINVNARFLQKALGLGAHGLFVLYAPAHNFAAHKNIVRYGEVAAQVQLLMDKADAQRQRFAGVAGLHAFAVEQDLALVRGG